jgi:hypothetical protein
VERNCHFLEFPAPKTHAAACAADPAAQAGELSAAANSGSGLGVAASTRDGAQRERLVGRGMMRAAKLREASHQARCRRAMGRQARRQAIARQVRLYCFRLDNCGTFMPLFCVRGESRIAVVWTLPVAAFSAVAPVHVRILSTHAAILSAAAFR